MDPFTADQIDLPDIKLEQGDIDVKSIKMSRKVDNVSGYATANLSSTVARPTLISGDIDASFWPVQFDDPRALSVVWAKGDFELDARGAVGDWASGFPG